jgi:hypothetical protein
MRYLIAFSPYGNGSCVVPTIFGCSDDYTLHCCCTRPSVVSFWKWSEMKICEVSKRAHDRGYGTVDEIALENSHLKEACSFDIAQYLENYEKRDEP